MNVKHSLYIIVLLISICFSCKKSTTTATPVVAVSTTANIDSITGTYTGTTSGDSIYTFVDTNGVAHQWLQSFSWPDTILVTSSDTATITAMSKYYNISYFYGDSLTIDSVTVLQNQVLGQNGYVINNTILTDTANNINHLIINVWYNYNKHLTSTVALLKR